MGFLAKYLYIIVDKETGEVLDDAQGYGYKSPQKAYAAYSYKDRDKTKDKDRQEKEKKIKCWMKSHKDFVRAMDTFSFEIAKGSWGPDDKFDTAFVRQMLKDSNLEVNFTAGELLRVWRKS